MFGQSAPSHGEDVSGVEGTPVVEGASPAIKHDEDLLTSDLSHCCRTNEVGVLPVHSLQFHTRLEVVFSGTGGFLTMMRFIVCSVQMWLTNQQQQQ